MDILFDINTPVPNATKLTTVTGYKSKELFDYDSLPNPFIKDNPIVDVLPITDLGETTKQWFNFEFTDVYNQKAFTGPFCGRNITDRWKTILGDTQIEFGDGERCRLTKTYPVENMPTHALIAATPGTPIEFPRPALVPSTYGVGDKYIALFDETSLNLLSPTKIYKAGLMASSGDMTDKLPASLITALGGPVNQGRNIVMKDVTWEVSVPTIEEYNEYILTFFFNKTPRTTRPLANVNVSSYYNLITSTPSPRYPNYFLAISPEGEVVDASVTTGCYTYLILKPVPH